jgi:aminopeptidase N
MVYRRGIITSFFLVLAFISQTGHSAVEQALQYDLAVSFDIPRSKLIGLATIQVIRSKPLLLNVGRLAIHSVRLNGRRLEFEVRNGLLALTPPDSGSLEINYDAVFAPEGSVSPGRDASIPSAISREGIFLTSAWYPRIEALARYRLKATFPRGFVAISEADKIDTSEQRGGVTFAFELDHPLDGINLVASDRFRITRERFLNIELSAYFFAEDQALARNYLDYAKKYIQLYEELLLPFPFKRFAIVENFLPTGYSMPTYTLLGQDVVRLPFIVDTSLGHEILHQWFGNQVFTGEKGGNWTEGLTTYLADHLYEERKEEGWAYRKQILIDYASYVRKDNEFSLESFTQRFNAASRAIGYGKTAMVFHMLRQMLGNETFFGGLKSLIRQKQFQRASWDDLRDAFETQSGKTLGWFFEQWVKRTGLPGLEMSGFTVERSGGNFALSFDLAQSGPAYQLDVPIKVVYKPAGEKKTRLRLDEAKKRVRLELDKEPATIILDEDFDIARKLADQEIPAVIGPLLGEGKTIVVRPVRDESYYQPVIESYRTKGAEVKPAEALGDFAAQPVSLLILGADSPAVRTLYGSAEAAERGFSIIAKKNPANPAQVVGIISSDSLAETNAAFPKIFHYGKYSGLRFENGVNVVKTVAPSERGIQKSVKDEALAIDLSATQSLSDVIERVAGKKIIYVGEGHDQYAHHLVQLQVLETLHRKNPKIALGMEMFPRPSQKAIDDYISGAIDERAFLKQSEYFKRWDVNYNLYKPLLDYARSHRIPVVALNLPREIVDKVGKTGLDSLSIAEKQEVSQDMDFSDEAYRARLEKVFKAHQHFEAKTFTYFQQAQILWDETMAESIDRFLKKNPDFRMVVVAGAGHFEYGSGIPKRTFRKNRLDYSILLSDAALQRDIADFIVFPEPAEAATTPRLMVYLQEQDRKVRITKFVPDSVSEKAGLKTEDVLLTLDGHPVESIEDVKIALFYKKTGDPIKVKIRRPAMLFGDEESEYQVTLR